MQQCSEIPEGDLLTMQWSKATPIQAWTGPEGSRRLNLPEFLDHQHVKVVRLPAALCTVCLYQPPPQRCYWYSLLLEGGVDSRTIVWPERLSWWKTPMTPPRIKPKTFQVAADYFNQLYHRIPQQLNKARKNWSLWHNNRPSHNMSVCAGGGGNNLKSWSLQTNFWSPSTSN